MPPPAPDSASPPGIDLPEEELRQWLAGIHPRPWTLLGAHLAELDGTEGARFAVWAPAARSVSVVVGEGDRVPMQPLRDSGVWACFVPRIEAGEHYRFSITGADGRATLRADPMARWTELRPGTASRLAAPSTHPWGDGAWMTARRSTDHHRSPMRTYEVHLGSWRRRPDGGWL